MPESKAPQVLFSGNKMNEPLSPQKTEAKRKKRRQKMDSVNQNQPRKTEFHREKIAKIKQFSLIVGAVAKIRIPQQLRIHTVMPRRGGPLGSPHWPLLLHWSAQQTVRVLRAHTGQSSPAVSHQAAEIRCSPHMCPPAVASSSKRCAKPHTFPS